VRPAAASLCFTDHTALDLVDQQGRKVVGSAQRRTGGRVLHHGSLPLTTPALTPEAGSVSLAAGRPVSWDELADAIVAVFQARWTGPLVLDEPGARELETARQLGTRMLTFLALQTGAVAETTESVLDSIMTLGGNLSYAEMWLWLTLVLLILEIFTSGFFIGALAVGSLVSAGSAWVGLGRNGQLVVFALAAIVSLVFVRPLFVRLLSPIPVETNAPSLVGQTGVVIDSVPAGGHGRVKLANEEWRATSASELTVGEAVRVLQVAGNTLTVDKA
jgi:membrane protein implicated in regulation of membrane protease activity